MTDIPECHRFTYSSLKRRRPRGPNNKEPGWMESVLASGVISCPPPSTEVTSCRPDFPSTESPSQFQSYPPEPCQMSRREFGPITLMSRRFSIGSAVRKRRILQEISSPRYFTVHTCVHPLVRAHIACFCLRDCRYPPLPVRGRVVNHGREGIRLVPLVTHSLSPCSGAGTDGFPPGPVGYKHSTCADVQSTPFPTSDSR